MREVLFRGKRVDNGKLIYGLIVKNCKGKLCIQEEKTEYKFKIVKEVIPETVGQYTGLKDKNGVKIFEGNIVKWGKEFYDGDKWKTYVIVWQPKKCGFGLKSNGAFSRTMGMQIGKNLEIIGNIHEEDK